MLRWEEKLGMWTGLSSDSLTAINKEGTKVLILDKLQTKIYNGGTWYVADTPVTNKVKTITTTIIDGITIAAGANSPSTLLGTDGTESEVWLAINIDKQPWSLLPSTFFGTSLADAAYPSYYNKTTAYATANSPAMALMLGISANGNGVTPPASMTAAKDTMIPIPSSVNIVISNGHATESATVTVKVLRIWR